MTANATFELRRAAAALERARTALAGAAGSIEPGPARDEVLLLAADVDGIGVRVSDLARDRGR